MTIKQLAYSAQQQLQSITNSSFKRAHIYELLAASFGFNSYAALSVDSVFARRWPDKDDSSVYNLAIRERCIELGYLPNIAVLASTSLPAFLTERKICVISISELVEKLCDESSYEFEYSDEEIDDQQFQVISGPTSSDEYWIESVLIDGLEKAAKRGHAPAHFALALINAPVEDDDERQDVGNNYWYLQAQQGRALTGVEKEWADAHAAYLGKAAKHVDHLREAARLGHQEALLELADRFDDPAFFEQSGRQVDADPALVAEIAERLGRPDDARKWLTLAAESGDTDAMRLLIEEYDHTDLQRCWTWMYLAELFGTDLSRDDYHAINNDGSAYDDDVGGPVFAAGSDGVKLDPINEEQDAAARLAAGDIFQRVI